METEKRNQESKDRQAQGKAANMQLTERDRSICRLCYEQQILSVRQIVEHFYAGEYHNAAKRLRRLEALGYLRTIGQSPTERSSLFTLSRRGRAVAESVCPWRIPQRRDFSPITLPHDLLVTDVRLRLSRFWNATWVPERALKAEEYPRIPDGVLIFPSQKKVAVEVERTLKSAERYKKLWRQWVGTGTALVLHVTEGELVGGPLRRHLEAMAPKDLGFGVVTWDALRAGTPDIWTQRGTYPLLTRREF